MKKLLLVILLSIPLCIYAQRFTGGVAGGLNVSQIHGDTEGGYRKAGFVGGAFVKTYFREKWGGLLEIRYAEKGSALVFNDQKKFRLQYIEIPILATYDAYKKIQPQAGISIGYLFRQMENDGNGYVEIPDDVAYDDLEVAACLGVNYQIFDNINLNLRYSISMIPIYQIHPGATSVRKLEASYNDVVSFVVYYQIGR